MKRRANELKTHIQFQLTELKLQLTLFPCIFFPWPLNVTPIVEGCLFCRMEEGIKKFSFPLCSSIFNCFGSKGFYFFYIDDVEEEFWYNGKVATI